MLESRIRYVQELTFGEEVEVTSDIEFVPARRSGSST